MNAPPNIRDLFQGHVTLQLQSLARLYLNGYLAHLQHDAGSVRFLSQHRGNPIASPALLGPRLNSFDCRSSEPGMKRSEPNAVTAPWNSKTAWWLARSKPTGC